MRRLSLMIGLAILFASLRFIASNPHGENFKTSCDDCHNTEGWSVNPDSISFDHDTTRFVLAGEHQRVNCRSCHVSLIFAGTSSDCFDCHTDIHQNTTGTDCGRCHSPESWLVADIIGLHNKTRFPLMGAHTVAACQDCHPSGSDLLFEPLGINCSDCHLDDYNSTTSPNHAAAGYSTQCTDCHFYNGYSWKEFSSHDQLYFPIYSGEHNGVWNDCADCHTNASDYTIFSCTTCHEHNMGDMNDEHTGVQGYVYESIACYGCHPNGSGEGSFNHNSTGFSLTGAHSTATCVDCHKNGTGNTSSDCFSCHEPDFNNSVNPDHRVLNIPNTCQDCHTTQPGWAPATFSIHNQYYELKGAHASQASQCNTCHNGNYNNTPNTCAGCHINDYNQTTSPSHQQAQFSTECITCHTEVAWQPATFDHDGAYFPIYSGKHLGEWNNCADCHTNPSDYKIFSCINCHEHNQADTDDEHQGIGGYIYQSEACKACHPTGDATGGFNHNNTAFPLTGAHTGADCISCHSAGYSGTTTVCSDCHTVDYQQAANPSHTALSLPNTCASCHTTEAGWSPAAFPVHNNYYVLNGAHAIIANNCSGCHNANYNTTPNTCAGCHISNYNQTTNPSHQQAQFPTECTICHTENSWLPSTFNHDAQYFPIYSGEHRGEWNTCADCHANPSNYAVFSCFGCHEQGDMDDEHNGISGYSYNNQACLSCHPNGNSMQRMRSGVKFNSRR